MNAECIVESFELLRKAGNPAKFRQNSSNSSLGIMAFGVAGNGKSTFLNELNRIIAEKQSLPFDKKWLNKASYGADGVTTDVTFK